MLFRETPLLNMDALLNMRIIKNKKVHTVEKSSVVNVAPGGTHTYHKVLDWKAQ